MRAARTIGIALLVFVIVYAVAVFAYNGLVSYQSQLHAWPLSAEQHANPAEWKPKTPDLIRILSLDGGGVRGLVTLEVLEF